MAESLLERARSEGTPLIEGGRAVFVWEGQSAPCLIGDFNEWDVQRSLEMHLAAPGVWIAALELPDDAYMEYIYLDEARGRCLDPLNSLRAPGLGDDNSAFFMPSGKPSELARRKRGVPHGTLTRVVLPTSLPGGRTFLVSRSRTVYFYQPPVRQPVPLLVVYDGREYLRQANLPVILDNLIHQGRMRPLALAMVENGGPARMMEYMTNESTLGFLKLVLLPAARQALNLVDVEQWPGTYGILGASMGGLMALYTVLRMPEIFGSALSQSGAFKMNEMDMVVWDLVRHADPASFKIWMDAGRFEWLLESNREMAALLRERGFNMDYHEFNARHNYPAWRDDLSRGLEFLFGPENPPLSRD